VEVLAGELGVEPGDVQVVMAMFAFLGAAEVPRCGPIAHCAQQHLQVTQADAAST
jgi:hypothetical protein